MLEVCKDLGMAKDANIMCVKMQYMEPLGRSAMATSCEMQWMVRQTDRQDKLTCSSSCREAARGRPSDARAIITISTMAALVHLALPVPHSFVPLPATCWEGSATVHCLGLPWTQNNRCLLPCSGEAGVVWLLLLSVVGRAIVVFLCSSVCKGDKWLSSCLTCPSALSQLWAAHVMSPRLSTLCTLRGTNLDFSFAFVPRHLGLSNYKKIKIKRNLLRWKGLISFRN